MNRKQDDAPDSGSGSPQSAAWFLRMCPRIAVALGACALLLVAVAPTALAATAPNLGTTSPYGIVSSTCTNSNTGTQTPTFSGNILDPAGITIGQFANLTGRALAFGGTVTTDANTISVPTCAGFAAASPVPSGDTWALMLLGVTVAYMGLIGIRRSRSRARASEVLRRA